MPMTFVNDFYDVCHFPATVVQNGWFSLQYDSNNMQYKFRLLSALMLGVFAITFLSNSNGVAHQQNKDRTGAPGSDNTCEQCHAGGSFAPQLSAFLVVDGDVELPGEYIPGGTHMLVINVTSTGAPMGYGVHGTAVLADGSNAGSFNDQDPNDCIWLDEVEGRHIFEQNDLCSSGTFEVEWVAPEAGSGPVSVYVASVTANGNGVSSGDSPEAAQFVFTEGTTGVETLADERFTLMQTATGQLTVDCFEAHATTLLSMDGRLLYEGSLGAGQHRVHCTHKGLVIAHTVTESGVVFSRKTWMQ